VDLTSRFSSPNGTPPAENTLMYYSMDRYFVDGIDYPTNDEGNGTAYIYSYC
jgi:hypothetical protein